MLAKAFLDELKLKCFLKTSGGKGLHIVVPLSPVANWDEVKDFSEAIVVHLARTVPQRFVAKSGPKNRVGKIFIDYLRNTRGATTTCRLLGARAAWIGRLDAISMGRAEGLEECEPVEHHERAQSISKATNGSVAGLQAHTAGDQTCGANTFGRLKGRPMATALNKELKREVLIKDKPYTLTLGPTGSKLTLKGHRNGVDLKWEDIVGGDAALATALNASVHRDM